MKAVSFAGAGGPGGNGNDELKRKTSLPEPCQYGVFAGPGEAGEHYKQGIQFFDREQLTEAIQEWKLVWSVDPDYKRVDYLITKAKTILKNIRELREGQEKRD